MADVGRFAVSSDFVDAYSRLRPPLTRSVLLMLESLHRDPSIRSWHSDPSPLEGDMQAFPVTADCWAVIQRFDAGMVMHWIGSPQGARDWALDHVCAVHPDTGSTQVYRRIDAAMLDGGDPPAGSDSGLLADRTDLEVRRLGVPEEQIEFVRLVLYDGEDSSLETLHSLIPDEAYESLFDLCLGIPYDEIAARLGVNRSAIASGSVLDGLATAESRRRFAVGLSKTELLRMLNEPLDKWRVFLHPAQRRPVERDWNGPVRILGGAGTGKTVVAIHRSRWLARRALDSPGLFASGGRVLLLTYTRNLASRLERSLGSLCSPEELNRIEVANIDRWVWHFLAERGVSRWNRLFGRHGRGFKTQLKRHDDLWRLAMARRPAASGIPDEFYWDEWLHVIQAQEVMRLDSRFAAQRRHAALASGSSLEKYLGVARRERGTRLAASTRRAIFPVFDTYWRELWRHRRIEWSTAYRVAAKELSLGGHRGRYASVVVDEAQDLGFQALRMVRAMVPRGKNDLMIVGDGHQRLYAGPRVVLKQCGIDVPGLRSIRLATCYRTSEAIREWAAGIMDGQRVYDLDDSTVANLGIGSAAVMGGVAPVVRRLQTSRQQSAEVVRLLKSIADLQPAGGVCIVARHNAILDRIKSDLSRSGIQSGVITGRSEPGGVHVVRLATMHRIKGLEFDTVVIVDANDGILPSSKYLDECADPESRREQEMIERSLLYVAATRARMRLYVFSWGTPSPYLPDA